MKTTYDYETNEEVPDFDRMSDYEKEEYEEQQNLDKYLEDEYYKSDDD